MVQPIDIPDATQEPQAYVAALLGTLGDRDPLAVYEATAGLVRELCAGLTESQWYTPMAPGEWNALQIVGHLFDVDIVYGFRWRLALTEKAPAYPGYNEKAWSELARPAPSALLDGFAGLRLVNAALLRALTDEDMTRVAVHGEQGEEDVARMIRKVAGHDLAHLNQLERTVAVARGT